MKSKTSLMLFIVLVATLLLVSCVSAVPSYEAVELANYSAPSESMHPTGFAFVDEANHFVVYKFSSPNLKYFYHFTPAYSHNCSHSHKGNPYGTAFYDGYIYFGAKGYLNADNHRIEKLNATCGSWSAYKDVSDGDGTNYLLGLDFRNGVLYGVGGPSSTSPDTKGWFCREPYVSGEAYILLYDFHNHPDFNSNFHLCSLCFVDEDKGDFLLMSHGTGWADVVYYFDADYTYLMSWTLPFCASSVASYAKMDFDDQGNLWIIETCNDQLHKLSLPNLPSGGDAYIVTLEGKTYDIDGSVVSGVDVEVGSLDDTSDEIGDYTISGIAFEDSMTVTATKLGYENYSRKIVGVYENGTYVHNIYMIPDDELENGDIGGLVYAYCTGVNIENALVNLYNKDTDDLSYIYSNSYGFYRFDDLANNTNFTLWASKADYEKSEKYAFLSDNTTHVIKDVWLLPVGGCVEPVPTPAPTPTPTPGDDGRPVIDGIIMIFDLFGLGDYMGYIFAFIFIAVMGLSFGYVTHGNSLAIAIGSFFGFIIDVAIGWLPVWLVAVVICATVYFIAKAISER